MSILKTLNHLYSNFFMKFLKDPSLVLYSILYMTPISTVKSNSSANHHLYADDTQLLLSFSALDFSHNITHLENTLTYPTGCLPISCLVILLKLSFLSLVYHNNSLNSIILPFIYITISYSHLLILLAILVSSLIKICHLHNISPLFLNHASTIFVTLDVFLILLIKLLPAPLLFLSYILKLTIVTFFYSIYLLHKRIVFNLSLTLLLVLSPKLLNFIILLLFLNLSTGSR